MSLPGTNLSGVYSNIDYPYGDIIFSNIILIYQDEFQHLAYNYLLETEDNHGSYHTFEEGFVHLQTSGRELHFEGRRRYQWGGAGGMGYNSSWCQSTIYQPQQLMQVYLLLNEGEIASAREKDLLFSDRPEVVLLRQEKEFIKGEPLLVEGAPIYEQADNEEDSRGLEATVVTTRKRLHNHWQEKTREYDRARLAAGLSPEDVACECDWTVESIARFAKNWRKLPEHESSS
ncbi:MAG TPA: hypothetical protein VFN35_15205 [Ktedonobacteraceae bacterium]|nr:hypothetical protein [Ktedonobacteraceae bacterium]